MPGQPRTITPKYPIAKKFGRVTRLAREAVKRNSQTIDSVTSPKKARWHWPLTNRPKKTSFDVRTDARGIFEFSHLLGIADLTANQINSVIDRSSEYVDFNREGQRSDILSNMVIVNAFFEPSTRTRLSFEFAAIRLGAHIVNLDTSSSSVNKGETALDTAKTICAMRPDVLIVRHAAAGTAREIAQKVECSIINAGDGKNEHPTQALIDALTIKRHVGHIDGCNVAICGDIRHSRVARSNMIALKRLGANVRLVGPRELLPDSDELEGFEIFTEMDEGISGADVVMMLRIQRERFEDDPLSSFNSDYHTLYGLTRERLERYAPDAIVMHPGPMNRGVEIDTEVADDTERSVILNQVEYGVAVRMACLDLVTQPRRP